jgi:hypothetical protein
MLRFRDRPTLYQIPVPCQGPERDNKTDARLSGIGQATSCGLPSGVLPPPVFFYGLPANGGLNLVLSSYIITPFFFLSSIWWTNFADLCEDPNHLDRIGRWPVVDATVSAWYNLITNRVVTDGEQEE